MEWKGMFSPTPFNLFFYKKKGEDANSIIELIAPAPLVVI